MKRYRGVLIFLLFALLALAGTVYYYDQKLGYLCLGATGVITIIMLLLLLGVARRQQQLMDTVFADNATAASRLIRKVDIPALLMDMNGKIVWRNDALAAVFEGKNVLELLPNFKPTQPTVQQILLAGTNYQVMTMPVHRVGTKKKLLFQYWLDRTEAVHYQRLYTEQMPYVMLVYMDNYEELAGDRQFHGTAVLAEVERLVSELCRRTGGIYRRYENGRFLCVLEAAEVTKIEKEKFKLLEQARHLETGTGATLSLSVAVGMAPRIAQSEEGARTAMELALGRGGDQAVVRDGADYRFYGGRKQQDARQSRVKMRLFAKALRQLIEGGGDVFIMGHKNPDMDCLGAALGIATCVLHTRMRPFIVLTERNDATADALSEMDRLGLSEKLLITGPEALEMVKPNSILVVVDTQRPMITDCPALLDRVEKIVLIDHHRRSADYIENPTLHYLESRASSASEMVTEVLQYYDESVRPDSFVCSALLAGIELDTKQFVFNVGSRTFEAAGYLRRNGADLTLVKTLFQNDFDSFVQVARTVEKAEIGDDGVAIAICEPGAEEPQLVAARAADELLKVKGVKAAFTLADMGDYINISGRSYGLINVQLILEQLGGGGHLTMAGAQVRGKTAEEAVALLKDCIRPEERQETTEEPEGGE
jgi:c-di-AMP phosphodiesterase-like protein